MERYNITVKDNPFDGCPYADTVVSDDGAYVRYDDAQRALDAERRERHAVEQIAGQALGYPWFKDDQKNFPGATEADGVCIGEHVAGTIVQELASKLATLQAQLRQVEGERAKWEDIAGHVKAIIERCSHD